MVSMIHNVPLKVSYNSLLLEVLSNITVAISIDKLSRSRLTPSVGLGLAVLDISGNTVAGEPPDLDSLCCQPCGVDAALVGVEALAVRSRWHGVAASRTI